MISIDREKCIACGSCERECFQRVIKKAEGRMELDNSRCIECGHCIAVCPADAVRLEGYDMGEVLELAGLDREIDPQVYLNHMKSRRSIRRFNSTPVTAQQLEMIIEAGRYSPTGCNLQNVSYFVSQRDIDGFRRMIIDELGIMAGEEGAFELWRTINEEYYGCGRDQVFFGAGTVVALASPSPQAACLAAAHMESMIYSMGLGMLYSGFSARAIAHSPAIRSYMGLKEGYTVYAVLVIGRPDVRFLRTVPRKKPDITYR